ncbi:MAG: hypothetical protein HY985_18730 [Magnetospirillum sp.]|nr:hypothetical protein [Magnetospirillum sp.]
MLVAILVSACRTVGGDGDTFDPAVMSTGTAGRPEQCTDSEHDAWVVVDGIGECLRYWHGGSLAAGSQDVVIWLHGDLLETRYSRVLGLTVHPIGGAAGSAAEQQARARRRAEAYGLPFVYLGRPGAMGSTGQHGAYRRKREHQLVNAALDVIGQRYGIARFHLAGHSGGGHVVASLLPLRRDIGCVVLSSGALALKMMHSLRGIGGRMPGLEDMHDPYETIAGIPRPSDLRIFVVGDRRDRIVPHFSQRLYYEGLRARGLDASLAEVEGEPPDYHSSGPPVERMIAACAKGQPTDAVLDLAARRL